MQKCNDDLRFWYKYKNTFLNLQSFLLFCTPFLIFKKRKVGTQEKDTRGTILGTFLIVDIPFSSYSFCLTAMSTCANSAAGVSPSRLSYQWVNLHMEGLFFHVDRIFALEVYNQTPLL